MLADRHHGAQSIQILSPDVGGHRPSLLFLVTGPRGVGKTTLCLRVVAPAREMGHSCAGLLTLREDGEQRAVVDVRTGHRRRLTLPGPPGIPVGRFFFDPEVLAWGAEVLARSAPCDLLVVDELGPLELAGGGWAVGLDVLRSGDFRLGLAVVRPELLAEFQARLPGAQRVEVTLENRDGLPVWLVGFLSVPRSPG